MKKKRRTIIFICTALLVAVGAAVLIAVCAALLVAVYVLIWPSSNRGCESNEFVDISWSPGGNPMTVRILLLDPEGAPLPGVLVHTVSESGLAPNTNLTDASGYVSIRPGEREFVGLYINWTCVFDGDGATIDSGLQVKVRIKDLSKVGLNTESYKSMEATPDGAPHG